MTTGPEPDPVARTALARITPPPGISARVTSARLTGFRGRLSAGTAILPALPAGPADALTFGVAGSAVQLHGTTGSHQVPAHTPWLVPTGSEWRVDLHAATDLRLVRAGLGGPGQEQNEKPAPSRPLCFHGPAGAAVRAALRAATPVWVDTRLRVVEDLARPNLGAVRLVEDRHDPFRAAERDTTFGLLVSWAMRRRAEAGDQELDALTRFVDRHLTDPALSSAMIAERTHVSRRTVQVLFTPYGGVSAFVRRRRTAAAVAHLGSDPRRAPDLDEVAALTGLGSRRTLERAIRQLYGLSPRQARAAVLAGRLLRPVASFDLLPSKAQAGESQDQPGRLRSTK